MWSSLTSRAPLLLIASTLGCSATPSAASPTGETPSAPDTAPPDNGETRTDAATLEVGARTDGVTLTRAEALELGALEQGGAPHVAGVSVTLTFDGEGPPPVTTARLSDDGRRVVVVVAGVRQVTADLPLITGEDGRALGEPRRVALGPLASMARTFLGDDSAIQIELELSAPARLRLEVGQKGRSVDVLLEAP